MPAVDSDMAHVMRERREAGRWESNTGRKENTRLDLGKNERRGERSENVKKEARRGETEKRGTLIALGRTNVKHENEQPKIGEKNLDSVVRKIKNREVERRSGKDARRSSLDEREFSGFNSSRASLPVRSPEAQTRQVTEKGLESSSGGGRAAGGGGGRGSRKQEQTLAKLNRGPPMVAPAPTRVKDSRPKGKTIRKAHYDPREVGQQFSMHVSMKCKKLISTSGVG